VGSLQFSHRPLSSWGEGSLGKGAANFALPALGVPLVVSPQKDTGSVSNQNCCRGFHFTEKVEKLAYVLVSLLYAVLDGPLAAASPELW